MVIYIHLAERSEVRRLPEVIHGHTIVTQWHFGSSSGFNFFITHYALRLTSCESLTYILRDSEKTDRPNCNIQTESTRIIKEIKKLNPVNLVNLV